MKKLRFVSAILAASVLFSATAFADFSDMPEDEGLKTAIENAVSHGILSGYEEDGTVRPYANITRAEMASIITRACGADAEGDISEFSDVAADAWYRSAFAKAYKMGAFSGDDQKLMHPQDNITFQECFTILSQVFDFLPPYSIVREAVDPETLADNVVLVKGKTPRLYDVSVLDGFADGKDVAGWAKVYFAGIVSNGGWNGENGLLTPTSYITRGQFAVVMDNLIKNYIDAEGTYTELPAGNTIVRCSNVVLDGVKSDSDVIVADCVIPFGIILNNVDIKRLVIRGCATSIGSDGTPENNDYGISPTGKYASIRVIRPYIAADLSNAKYSGLYAAEKTSVILGIIQQ